MNLVGEYSYKLDDKGRLSLPSAFRKALPKDLYISLSPDEDCLYVFDSKGFGKWVDSLFERDGGFDSSKLSHVHARTKLNSRAKSVDMDSSGRIGISAQQRAAAGLEKNVVVIGNTDHFEVWDAERWQSFAEKVDLKSIFTK